MQSWASSPCSRGSSPPLGRCSSSGSASRPRRSVIASIASRRTIGYLRAMVRVAIVGAGKWGINHVRAFGRIPLCEVRAVCDGSDDALAKAHKLVPNARLEKSFEAVLADDDIDAVVLATPAVAHAKMAIAAL